MTIQIFSFVNVELSPSLEYDLFIGSYCAAPRAGKVRDLVNGERFASWLVADKPAENGVFDSFPINSEVVLSDLIYEKILAWGLTSGNIIPRILVDISTMSQQSMATVISAVTDVALEKNVELSIAYVVAEFTPPPEVLPPNDDIRPISEKFAGWPNDTSAKTSLIVGLGYENGKAEGACEFFDASDTWVFFPKSPVLDYDLKVLDNNEQLIHRLRSRNKVVYYPVDDPECAFGELASVVSVLAHKSNPVILPFGPKVFFLYSILLSKIYPQAGVWQVSGDSVYSYDDQKPSLCVVGFRVLIGVNKFVDL